MAKLRRLNGKEVVDILETLGFEVRRITGSHHHLQWKQADVTCRTSVPVHGSKALATGTLKKYLSSNFSESRI
ncbi:addiction module toxin, HicA family [bacterium]|nr:addiction module toxin, HicA family [bacterium]